MPNEVKLVFRVTDEGSLQVLDQAGKKLDEVGGKATDAGTKGSAAFEGIWAGATKATAAVTAAATAYAALKAVGDQLELGDRMEKLSQQTGIAASTLSEYRYGLEQNSASIESFTSGIGRLSSQIAKNREDFAKLGIDTRQSLQGIIEDTAELFRMLPAGSDEQALARRLFGGPDMIEFMNQGREGIRGLTAEAHQLGATMSDEFAASSAEFYDNLDKIKSGVGGVAHDLAEQMLPALVMVTDAMVEATKVATLMSSTLSGAVSSAAQGAAEWWYGVGDDILTPQARHRATWRSDQLAGMSAANNAITAQGYTHNYGGFVGPMPNVTGNVQDYLNRGGGNTTPESAKKVADELGRAKDNSLGLSLGIGEMEKRLRASQQVAVEFVDILAVGNNQTTTKSNALLDFFTTDIPNAVSAAADAIQTTFQSIFGGIESRAVDTAQAVSGVMRNVAFNFSGAGQNEVNFGLGYGITYAPDYGGFSTPDGGVGYSNGVNTFTTSGFFTPSTGNGFGSSISGINAGSNSFGNLGGLSGFGGGGSAPGPSKHDLEVADRAASSIWEGIKRNTAAASPFTAADLFPSTAFSAKRLGDLSGAVDWSKVARGDYSGLQLGGGGRGPMVGKRPGGINLTQQALDIYGTYEGLGILLGITASDFNGGESGVNDEVSNIPGGLGIAAVKRASLLGLTKNQIDYETQQIINASGFSQENALNILNQQLYAGADIHNNPYKNADDPEQVTLNQEQYNAALKTTTELFNKDLPAGVDAYAIALKNMASGPMGTVVDILAYNKELAETVALAGDLQSALTSGASSAIGGQINAVARGGTFSASGLRSGFMSSVGQGAIGTLTGLITNQLTNSQGFKDANAALFQSLQSGTGVDAALAMFTGPIAEAGNAIQALIPTIKLLGETIEEAAADPAEFYSGAKSIQQAQDAYNFGLMNNRRKKRTALGSVGAFNTAYDAAMYDGSISQSEYDRLNQSGQLALGQLGALGQTRQIQAITNALYDKLGEAASIRGDTVAFSQVNAAHFYVDQLILSTSATEAVGRSSNAAANDYRATHGLRRPRTDPRTGRAAAEGARR